MATEKPKKPTLFDPEALLDAQRRSIAALTDAGNIVADGMRSYAERHVTIVQESMGHLWSELQSAGKRAPAAPTDQLERMRAAFEAVVAQVQELGNHMLEVQRQAVTVLNECASKNLEALGASAPEIAALQQKAKSAFELASKQTTTLIEEMKKRMASLEPQGHKGTAAASPSPKEASPAKTEPAARTAAAPKPTAPPPAAPKPAARKPTTASRAKPKPKPN
ncbi:MAG: phasin family protein [Geminicoccaceae bacterium]|jgi:hypothetical protein